MTSKSPVHAVVTRRRALGLAASVPAAGALWLAGTSPTRSQEGRGPVRLPIGMNLTAIADWEPGYPFINAMWGAREWFTRSATLRGPWHSEQLARAELDGDGYPLEVPFGTGAGDPQVVFTILPNVLKAGRYVVLYEGEGIITVGGGSKLLRSDPGRLEISMAHRGNDTLEELWIKQSLRGNHVRNIRVVPAEFERENLAENPFRPELLDFCKQWNCLRFMDWLGTNGSVIGTWGERKRTSFYTQIGAAGDRLGMFGQAMPPWRTRWSSGVALELCIDLANKTRSDCWLCVPHMADEAYITGMAELVKARLDPTLKAYVEYSNEVWNWGFVQSQWMLQSELAGSLVEAGGGRPPWKDRTRPTLFKDGLAQKDTAQGTNHPERIGALFRYCFKIWERVFSGEDRRRLVRVCAVQAHWIDASKNTLNWVMKNGGCDALAPAGYFAPNDAVYAKWESAGARLTADDVISDMREMMVAEAEAARANAAVAKAAGIRLICYEGGQHIQPKGQAETPYNPALAAAQTHPGMYDLYQENFKGLVRANCDLFCAYNSVGKQGSRYGSWGHIASYGQSPAQAPKYRALLDAQRSPG